jgi:hypothetical protein
MGVSVSQAFYTIPETYWMQQLASYLMKNP